MVLCRINNVGIYGSGRPNCLQTQSAEATETQAILVLAIAAWSKDQADIYQQRIKKNRQNSNGQDVMKAMEVEDYNTRTSTARVGP